MDKKEYYKANIDFFKTMAGISIGMSLTTIVAFWSNVNIANIPLKGFAETSFWCFLAAVCFFVFYFIYYVKLINILRK